MTKPHNIKVFGYAPIRTLLVVTFGLDAWPGP